MAERVERLATWVEGGVIRHQERVVPIEYIEGIAGRRLDRRRSYAVIGGEVHDVGRWTRNCSGCSDDREFVLDTRGGGCEECGYTGVRRCEEWQPINPSGPRGVYEFKSMSGVVSG